MYSAETNEKFEDMGAAEWRSASKTAESMENFAKEHKLADVVSQDFSGLISEINKGRVEKKKVTCLKVICSQVTC